MSTIRKFRPVTVQTFEIKFDVRSCHPEINEERIRAIIEETLRLASSAINSASPNVGFDVSFDTMSAKTINVDDDLS